MAAYTNPLDEFQSHSVHYVVVAARSTEDLRPFTDSSETAMASTLRAIDACDQLGRQVQVPGSPANGTFLMIDTRRFSQFTVTDFEITAQCAGFAVPGSQSPNSVGQDMKFTVLDNQGISFANFLQYLMTQKLGVSFQGMTILVRVLFIGHTSSGQTKLVQSIGIPAIFSEIQVDLNETKGVYACKCHALVGMASNAQNNAQWTSIGTASSYFTGTGANTLGAVITSFEERLNDESRKRFTQLNAKTPTQGGTTQARYGRPVQYMITLPKGWDQFKFTGPAQNAAHEINFKQLIQAEETAKAKTITEQQKKAQTNTATAKDSFVAVNPDMTITEVLDIIFNQTLEIHQLGNFTKPQAKTSEIRFYKHMVSVTSDDASFTVHIDVVEYIVPNVELNNSPQIGSTTSAGDYDKLLFDEIREPGRVPIKVPKNFLEFDYIFSGKNIDVLHLDLKIENLNIILMQQTKLGAGEMMATADDAQKQVDGDGVGADTRTTQGLAQKDPVLMPMRTGDQSTNFSNIASNVQALDGQTPQALAQGFTRNISDFYNGGPLKAKMTIRGNPQFLERLTLSTLAQHVSASTLADTSGTGSSTNPGVKKQYREAFEKNLLELTPGLQAAPGGGFRVNSALRGPKHLVSPVYVKVNVFGPNVDFITNELIAGQNFGTRLFYNNYYYVFSVRTKIEGSKFTQEFDLSPFSVFGRPSSSAQGQNTSTVKEIK